MEKTLGNGYVFGHKTPCGLSSCNSIAQFHLSFSVIAKKSLIYEDSEQLWLLYQPMKYIAVLVFYVQYIERVTHLNLAVGKATNTNIHPRIR